mmetsp:Transcript_136633/g.237239  ORF Transcript_136633/g.237239 Transcript_136633/m.237239 type:complete len:239 (+) Transcript_136633:1222-1938(+)
MDGACHGNEPQSCPQEVLAGHHRRTGGGAAARNHRPHGQDVPRAAGVHEARAQSGPHHQPGHISDDRARLSADIPLHLHAHVHVDRHGDGIHLPHAAGCAERDEGKDPGHEQLHQHGVPVRAAAGDSGCQHVSGTLRPWTAGVIANFASGGGRRFIQWTLSSLQVPRPQASARMHRLSKSPALWVRHMPRVPRRFPPSWQPSHPLDQQQHCPCPRVSPDHASPNTYPLGAYRSWAIEN